MTQDNDELTLVRRVVTVADIRSSTSILEDLKQTDNQKRWRDLLIALKHFLLNYDDNLGLQVYKFIGDGWVLVLREDVSKAAFTQFLVDFSIEFQTTFNSSIAGLLQHAPGIIGLTFGVDAGELVQLEMNSQVEYLGRAINVAARLQDAAKRIEPVNCYQALFSNNSFNAMPSSYGWASPLRRVQVPLRNVANGERYECLAYEPLLSE